MHTLFIVAIYTYHKEFSSLGRLGCIIWVHYIRSSLFTPFEHLLHFLAKVMLISDIDTKLKASIHIKASNLFLFKISLEH